MVVLDELFFFWETKKWSLVALDRWLSYTVTIVPEFASARLRIGRLTEVLV